MESSYLLMVVGWWLTSLQSSVVSKSIRHLSVQSRAKGGELAANS
jgi:hypothetical protein